MVTTLSKNPNEESKKNIQQATHTPLKRKKKNNVFTVVIRTFVFAGVGEDQIIKYRQKEKKKKVINEK